jgi:hypothetical protein
MEGACVAKSIIKTAQTPVTCTCLLTAHAAGAAAAADGCTSIHSCFRKDQIYLCWGLVAAGACKLAIVQLPPLPQHLLVVPLHGAAMRSH